MSRCFSSPHGILCCCLGDTDTGHGNRLPEETATSVSFVKIFRTKGT